MSQHELSRRRVGNRKHKNEISQYWYVPAGCGLDRVLFTVSHRDHPNIYVPKLEPDVIFSLNEIDKTATVDRIQITVRRIKHAVRGKG